MVRARAALAVCLALAALLTVSCGRGGDGDPGGRYEALRSVVQALGSHPRRETRFHAETSFRGTDGSGDGSILYTVSGIARCDKTAPWAHQSYTAVWLGASIRGEDLFRNGSMVHTENGTETVTEQNTEDALLSFPFRDPPVPEESEPAELTVSDGLNGIIYTLTVPGTEDLAKNLAGMDWYELARIVNPDRARERIGPLTLRYTVSGGIVRSFAAEFTVTVFEKSGYTPGYSDPEADGLALSVRVQWTYEAFDDAVSEP